MPETKQKISEAARKGALKSCPFCGAAAIRSEVGHDRKNIRGMPVKRADFFAGCLTHGGFWRNSAKKADDGWNTRAEPAQAAIDAELKRFCEEVNERAEMNMLKTGRLEGSHYAAMTAILKERGL